MKHSKKSMKPIPSSMRGKKRYILFKMESGKKLKPKDVSDTFWESMLTLHGTMGTAAYRFWFIDFKPASGKGIVRCANNAVDEVKSALLFIEKVRAVKVIPSTLLTSGSMKKLKSKL